MKKFLITVVGSLSILIHSPYASSKQLQVANCPTKTAYACCIQDAWTDVLWVESRSTSKITSYRAASDVCRQEADAIVDKWTAESCVLSTSVFNQPSGRISSSCVISQYDTP